MAFNDIYISPDRIDRIMQKAERQIFIAGLLYSTQDEKDAAKVRIVRDLFGDECLRQVEENIEQEKAIYQSARAEHDAANEAANEEHSIAKEEDGAHESQSSHALTPIKYVGNALAMKSWQLRTKPGWYKSKRVVTPNSKSKWFAPSRKWKPQPEPIPKKMPRPPSTPPPECLKVRYLLQQHGIQLHR